MASPHVAGTAALYLATYGSTLPATVEQKLKSAATVTGTNANDGAAITRVNASSY